MARPICLIGEDEMTDYGIYYREEIKNDSDWARTPNFDVFLSAFNHSERVLTVYEQVKATRKLWLIHAEYGIQMADLPQEPRFETEALDESTYCKELLTFLEEHAGFDPAVTSLCIDITGVVRPHLLFLTRLLHLKGVKRFYAIYAEPIQYTRKEKTVFSSGAIHEVRPIHGFGGSRETETSSDYLIIGMGYDDRMMAEVAEDRAKAEKHQLFGLPSLQADMYQQSVIRSRKAADEMGDPEFSVNNRSFAPANDPFGTADVLAETVSKRRANGIVTNLYLSPLGTKAQALGFALYFIHDCLDSRSATILYPFSHSYEAETSSGLARAWLYTVEF
nr:hypothetical protein [uncultured Rhodopila sp.]